MTSRLDDVRLALRSLCRSPGFTAAVIVTLALGIGPNTTIFSAVHALLLRPLPFPDADQLVRLEASRGGEPTSLSYREIRDFREELKHIFEDVAAYTDQGQYNASGDGRPEELVSTITTQNLFRASRARDSGRRSDLRLTACLESIVDVPDRDTQPYTALGIVSGSSA